VLFFISAQRDFPKIPDFPKEYLLMNGLEKRGGGHTHRLPAELDDVQKTLLVLVIGATNRPNLVDFPALQL